LAAFIESLRWTNCATIQNERSRNGSHLR